MYLLLLSAGIAGFNVTERCALVLRQETEREREPIVLRRGQIRADLFLEEQLALIPSAYFFSLFFGLNMAGLSTLHYSQMVFCSISCAAVSVHELLREGVCVCLVIYYCAVKLHIPE